MSIEETAPPDPVSYRRLDRIAGLVLEVGRLLMESGSRVSVVHRAVEMIACGLGVGSVNLRCGYASMAVTLVSQQNSITRLTAMGRLGVNQQLDLQLRALAFAVGQKSLDVDELEAALAAIKARTMRHPVWLVSLSVGLACAAFGRLFGVDWPAFVPVLLAGAIGQYVRHGLLHRGFNLYVVAAFIAFLAGTLGGLGARLAGSATIDLAMMASILLLVPGVPATNAQTDIMEGFPTMGSARFVSVAMVMVFAATGVWFAETVLGVHL